MSFARRFASVALVAGLGLSLAGLLSAGEVLRPHTLFNLAGAVRAYLSVDAETGDFQLAPTSGVEHSGTYWQLLPIGRYRGYRAHLIVSRGNSQYNGMFLAVDETTGQLKMSDDREADTTKWLIRYAGYFQGYDAYHVQLLGRTDGGHDLKFLAVDENGKVVVQREPADPIHWRVRRSSILPAEVIR